MPYLYSCVFNSESLQNRNHKRFLEQVTQNTLIAMIETTKSSFTPNFYPRLVLSLFQQEKHRISFQRLQTVIENEEAKLSCSFGSEEKFVTMLVVEVNLFPSHASVVLDIYGSMMTTHLNTVDPDCFHNYICIERSKQCFDAAFYWLNKSLLANNSEFESQSKSTVGSTSEAALRGLHSLQNKLPLQPLLLIRENYSMLPPPSRSGTSSDILDMVVNEGQERNSPCAKVGQRTPNLELFEPENLVKEKHFWTIMSTCHWMGRAKITAAFRVTLDSEMEFQWIHQSLINMAIMNLPLAKRQLMRHALLTVRRSDPFKE